MAAALTSACRTPLVTAATAHPKPDIAGDTAMFATVVRAAARAASREPTRVDPRPMRADTALYIPDVWQPAPGGAVREPDPMYPTSAEMLEQRRKVLQRLRIEETDAAADMKCPGVLTPPSSVRDRSRCPTAGGFNSVILSVPRRPVAGDQIRMDSVGLRPENTWIVRVSARSMGADGASTLASDYFVTRKSRTEPWSVAKVIGLMWVE
ncbi:MAG: hypothetical protein WKF55_12225 [Gemmatimonadaceae bacterium]